MAVTYNERKTFLRAEGAGSTVEVVAGVAIVVLAAIGMSSGYTGFLGGIATIILGCALFVFGATIANEFQKLLSRAGADGGIAHGLSEFSAGLSIEVSVGCAAIVLGILALIGFSPEVLVSCAVITVGVGMILSAASFRRLNALRMTAAGATDYQQQLSEAAISGAVTTQALAGMGAAVLGIVALVLFRGMVGAHAMQAGLIVLGGSLIVSGTALTGRILRTYAGIR